jgi:hypothetical protein
MKLLARCVVLYARCLCDVQPLLPPLRAAAGQDCMPQLMPFQRCARDADLHLASLDASIAGLPELQRGLLRLMVRQAWRPALAGKAAADPVGERLVSGLALGHTLAPETQALAWQDATLAGIALRSLRYALRMTEALPEISAGNTLPGFSGQQHAAAWGLATLLEEQQAALWDAMEKISTADAALLAQAARAQLAEAKTGSQDAEMLAYFASGVFAERVHA